MKRITDPEFKYVSAADTDLRKTFKRIRRELLEVPKPEDTRGPRLAETGRRRTNAA